MKSLSLLACILIGACSSDDDSGMIEVSAADAGTDAATSPPIDAAPLAPSCTDEADFNACAACFANENAAGSAAYSQAIISSCYCANECVTECMAGCADPAAVQQGDPCDTCVNQVTMDQNSACVQGFGMACQADQSCLGFAMSLQSCQ